MQLFSLIDKLKNKLHRDKDDDQEETTEEEHEEIKLGTKIKIIVALVVVAMGAYVAYWVQEPTDVKVDLLEDQGFSEDAAMDPMVADAEADLPMTAEVSIVDFSYVPSELTVEQGTTVIWTNMDTAAHTVTGDGSDVNPEWTMSSGQLEPGVSFSYDFSEPGTYNYSCTFHPQMKGTIIVMAAEGMGSATSAGLDLPETTEDSLAAAAPEDEVSALLEETDSMMMETSEPELYNLDSSSETSEYMEETMDSGIVTLDVDELLADQDALHEAAMIADESDELATTGPEDIVYFAIFGVILYLNRRKILGSLN